MSTAMIYLKFPLVMGFLLAWTSYPIQLVTSSRILFLSVDPLGSRSHKFFYMAIAEALVERGHHVTMVSSFRNARPVPNIRDIVLKTFNPEEVLSSVFRKGGREEVVVNLLLQTPSLCVEALGQKEMQALKRDKFDIIIISFFFNFCQLAFVDFFKVPFIYVFPTELVSPFSDMMGNVDFPSIVPHKLLNAVFPPTFLQRVQSTILDSVFAAIFPIYVIPKMFRLCREKSLCPPEMPSLLDISNNASLAIINSVRALEWPPRPMMPNIVYAGGAHIKPAKNVSSDLSDWIAGAGKAGFIYFSTGSAVTPSTIPERYRKVFIRVFRSLPQRVLWKWDDDTMLDLPKNVKLSKWVPQQDVLGHSMIRLFITHGGLFSTQESTYHAVPIVGMPVFADQFSNMLEAERGGWGRMMQWKDLEEDSFRALILDTINNKSIKNILSQRSALMRDTPIPPAQKAAFWVEYVIRHKGAFHMVSPLRKMKLYEIYNFDVWIFIIGCCSAVLYLLWLQLKFALKATLGFVLASVYIKKRKLK